MLLGECQPHHRSITKAEKPAAPAAPHLQILLCRHDTLAHICKDGCCLQHFIQILLSAAQHSSGSSTTHLETAT
jgi:hypothetical protein